jgi:hypothetical protein
MVTVAVSALGCTKRVRQLPASLDHPPTISVTGFPVDGSVPKEVVNGPITMRLQIGTRVMISATAENRGGVKTLSVVVKQGTAVLYEAETAGRRDLIGRVPEALFVLGTDGAGHAGSKAMTFTMSPAEFVVVTVTASNFNGQSSGYDVSYVTFCENCLPNREANDFCECSCPFQRSCQGAPDGGCCADGQKCCKGNCVPFDAECSNEVCEAGQSGCGPDKSGGCCRLGSTCCGSDFCCPRGTSCQGEICIPGLGTATVPSPLSPMPRLRHRTSPVLPPPN